MSCGDPHETDCGEVLDRIYEYLDRELTEADYGKIRQHLHECGPCLREHDLDVALKTLVRRCCQSDVAPDELRLRILARITKVRVEQAVIEHDG
ncbi:MAG: mycothiol system anti-sigma-R factor [Angustibacter sp.]